MTLDIEKLRPGLGRALLGIFTVLLAPLLFGVIIGSTGPSIDTMKNEVRDKDNNILRLDVPNRYVVFNNAEAAWFASLVTIGAMVGALASGYLADAVGFKRTLLLTAPMYTASFLAIYTGSNVAMLFAARTLTGVAVGINSFVAPTYIADLSPVKLRGLFGALNQLCITLGILLVYFLGMKFRVSGNHAYSAHIETEMHPLSDAETTITPAVDVRAFCDWRMLALVNIVPSIVLGLLAFFIPESPTWLATKLYQQRVNVTGSTVLGDNPVEKSAETGKAPESRTKWSLLVKSRKQLILGVVLQFFQQFSGINAVMFFCTSIMRDARVAHAETYSATVMLEQFLVTGAAVFLMDIAGRKVLLLIGASVMAGACGVIGLYFYLVQLKITGIFVIVLIGMYSYIAAFSIGVGAIPWLILGEIFPAETRATGASIATCANWIFAFVVTLAYQPAAALLTTQGVMWFFGICCVGLVVYTALCVPETKGKTFEEIQQFFADGNPSPPKREDVEANASKTVHSRESDPLIADKRDASQTQQV